MAIPALPARIDPGLTARLCMSETFVDNPSRERQQYGGDGRMQALYAYWYFGDTRITRQFLRHYAQGRRADGALQSAGPWCWNQIIPAWTLHWVEAIREHLEYTGDRSLAGDLAGSVVDALQWFRQFVGTDGLLTIQERWGWANAPGGVVWNFIDWQGKESQLKGEPARLTLNGIYLAALRTASLLMQPAGRMRESRSFREQSARVGRSLRAVLESTDLAKPGNEHVLAYATLAGLVQGHMAPVARRARDGTLRSDLLYLFFTLQALEQEGHAAAVVATMRHVLGPMIADGSATVYETRHARDSRSRTVCQSAGAFAGYFLPRIIGGIRPSPRAQRQVLICPQPEKLTWAESTVPVADGDIRATWRRTRSGLALETSAPKGWQVKVVLV